MNKTNPLPNILSLMRMLCSAILLLVAPLSILFYVLYLLCGVSDALDGYIARRTNSTSSFGASLDSVADFVFIGVTLIVFLPILHLSLWLLCWIGAITLVRISSLIIGFVKYRAFAFIHTYANKATGSALFCFPFLYHTTGLTLTSCILCGLATYSAVEELLIHVRSKELLRDAKRIH
ncbi:CDP-alcohol phosphatidyltransferase [Paenibacillus sp. PK3_47]|uniref:CDP-alcohol phosphatidyltransferase family protein n=1 Tax=Paenibacillus sp. PK3_47 TaxID=2072642 RepID=UPI00201DD524|nr:CDP-alcohol phosphatidyltransferase family protein [Paenibacillus sp. PK3_47]UQZ37397.1 CDP-alcohol phosphatidyltransferase [Paenibacillus sp. PK3_47]